MLGSESGPRLKCVHIWVKFMSARMSERTWVRIKAWRIRRSQKWNVLNYHSPLKTLSANCPNRYSQMKSLASALWQVIFQKKKCSFIKCGNDFIPISTATFLKTEKKQPSAEASLTCYIFLDFFVCDFTSLSEKNCWPVFCQVWVENTRQQILTWIQTSLLHQKLV